MDELISLLIVEWIAVQTEHAAGVLFLTLFFATFLSEDLACVAAGGLVAGGRVDFAAAVTVCFLGIFAGDLMLYWVGRLFGGPFLRGRLGSRLVSKDQVVTASSWLERRGTSAVFLSRFVSGSRLPTYLAAGALKTDFAKFALWFAVAAAIWTPLLIGAAAFGYWSLPSGGVVFAAAATWLGLRFAMKLRSAEFRKRLTISLRRIWLWEFWPVQIFYLPVVFYVLLLGLKHRNLTLFTAANPAFPAGGFVGESKNEIYRLLGRSPVAKRHMIPHRLIGEDLSIEERVDSANSFMEENRLSYPIVVKPDKGERGRGVVVARSLGELANALLVAGDLLVQQHVEGVEASVFYIRGPQQENGVIFSITEKQFPEVVGDGVSDIRQLIEKDVRASLISNRYVDHNRHRLDRIPAKGVEIKLIDIGSHSRGAIFLDGDRLRTQALENEIDRVCRGIHGFYFGRFDIRAASSDRLMNGDFKIIELNGVTSESTNIYDPRYSLVDAYRILFRQWRLAFEIGRVNVKRGARACTVRELLAIIFNGLYPSPGPKFHGSEPACPSSQCA
jgi:membrane protein DedA with SNARE-associated domain